MAPRRRDGNPRTPATPNAPSTPSHQDSNYLQTPLSASILRSAGASSPRSPGQQAITPITPSFARSAATQRALDIIEDVWGKYLRTTPKRIKVLDVFLLYLMVVGALQFFYCAIKGDYPFHTFLAGFGAAVGQFVLTASLRIQINLENRKDFGGRSEERAFADFIFGSLILHFFCMNYVN